jgi:large subunit ribosomal protein L7/L12
LGSRRLAAVLLVLGVLAALVPIAACPKPAPPPAGTGDGGATAPEVSDTEAAPPEAAKGPATFDVVITAVGEHKIQVIKVVRERTGLGLADAKALVESAPDAIVEKGLPEDKAQEAKAGLEEVGATVEVRPAA